ncbi:hypothetical protein I4U23_016814 [Adineta vaga]|nr:hypothetical protein I4U23_016814 [Adineta vaga]
MDSWTILPVPIDSISEVDYGNESFLEIHLDERYEIGEDFRLCKVWTAISNMDNLIIEKSFMTFYDADQCINFIASYEWRKIFLTLTDKFSYLIELIHDLPQVVFFYIYSQIPNNIPYTTEQYRKLRAIVNEESANADDYLLKDIERFQQDLMPMKVVKPIKRKTKLLIQEPINIDKYSIIWLQNDKNNISIDTSLISNIIDSLKVFFCVNQCMDFIKLSTDTNFFVIISHTDNTMIVEQISAYSQVITVYILQNEEESIVRSMTSIPKLHGIYSDIVSLSEELSNEYKRRLKCSEMPLSVFLRDNKDKTVRDLNKENVRFLWFQLLIDILIKIPYNEQAKSDMLYECRKHYGIPCGDDNNNDDSMKTIYDRKAKEDIDNFEKNYKPTEAVRFYTNDSFLYRLFNRAFRTENIDLLFICRFFLADVYKQLQDLHCQQFPDQLPHTVFRGQFMTHEEFQIIQDNIDGLMSVNTFLSTSRERHVATIYGGSGLDSTMLSVLFEIELDITGTIIKRPFAGIEEFSRFPDEREVLFAVGSIFRIVSVEDKRSLEGFWCVKLKLIDKNSDLHELQNELEKQYCSESNLRGLGLVLHVIGDYERAERYFLMLLEYIPEGNFKLGQIYADLGSISLSKGDYQKAIEYHEKSLEYFSRPDIFDQRENIGRQHVDIGVSHQRLGDLNLALKYFLKALDIQKLPQSLSYTYNQIAMLYKDQGEKHLALEYFQKTLHIEEHVLKTNQYAPVLATMYNNIGEIYTQLNDYDNALKYLHHALDIRLKGTVSTHTDLAAIYINLGNLYQRINEPQRALEVLEKALKIDTNTFGNDHESLVVIHNNLSTVYIDMKDLPRALYHSETALRILLRSQAGENHIIISIVQLQIANIQLSLGNNIKALKIARKALDNQLKIFPENHEKFVHTYSLLSKIYMRKKDITSALEYMEKAVEIARIIILPKNPLKFQTLQHHLDLLKSNPDDSKLGYTEPNKTIICVPDDYDQQDHLLSNFRDELEQTSTCHIVKRLSLLSTIELFSQNETCDTFCSENLEHEKSKIYFSIAQVYYRQQNWTMALTNYEKALDSTLKQNSNHLWMAEIYHGIGLAYTRLWDFSKAIEYIELAISTARIEASDDHPRIKIFFENLNPLKQRFCNNFNNN